MHGVSGWQCWARRKNWPQLVSNLRRTGRDSSSNRAEWIDDRELTLLAEGYSRTRARASAVIELMLSEATLDSESKDALKMVRAQLHFPSYIETLASCQIALDQEAMS